MLCLYECVLCSATVVCAFFVYTWDSKFIAGVPLRRDLCGTSHYCAPLVCVLNFSGVFAVWWLQ